MKKIFLFLFALSALASQGQGYIYSYPTWNGNMSGVSVPADLQNGSSHSTKRIFLTEFPRLSDSGTVYVSKYKNASDSLLFRSLIATKLNITDTGVLSTRLTGAINAINAIQSAGYITSSALSPYLTSSTAASTYHPLENQRLSTTNNVTHANITANGYYIGSTLVLGQSSGNIYYQTPSGSFIWNNAAGTVQNMTLNNAGALNVPGSITGGTVTGADLYTNASTAPSIFWGSSMNLSRRGVGIASLGNGTRDDASGTLLLQHLTATGNVTGANLNIANWNTAFGWGNHASAGYALQSALNTTNSNVATNTANIATNTTNIASNTTAIAGKQATLVSQTNIKSISINGGTQYSLLGSGNQDFTIAGGSQTLQQTTAYGKVTPDTITAAGFTSSNGYAVGNNKGKFNITTNNVDGGTWNIFNIGYNVKNGNVENAALPLNSFQGEVMYPNFNGSSYDTLNEIHWTMAGRNQSNSKRLFFATYNLATANTQWGFYADQFYIGNQGGNGFINPMVSILPVTGTMTWRPDWTKQQQWSLGTSTMQLTNMAAVITDSAAGNYASMALVNNNNRTWSIRHKGTSAGNSGRLEFIHSSLKYAVIDSFGYIGVNTAPDYQFHAKGTGTEEVRLKLETGGNANAGVVYYTNGSFRGDINFSGSGVFQFYHAASASYPWYILANGRIGLANQTSPTAKVHIGAGTSTANTAPLKLTSGTNLTTAEAGAFEYDGTNLFFTRTGTTRESILSAPGVNTISPTSPNRTIAVVINGTTYYIAAKTTND